MGKFSNTLRGSAPHLLAVAAASQVYAKYGAIGMPDNPIHIIPQTLTATNVYARNRTPKNVTGMAAGDQFKVNGYPLHVRLIADGTKGAAGSPFSESDYPELVNLFDVGAEAAFNAAPALRLRNVVLANGVILDPEGNDAVLAGSDFKVVDNAGTMELYVEKSGGGAYAAGTVLDVYMDPSATQITTYAIGANLRGVPQEAKGHHFWSTDQAITLFREPAG